MENRKEFLKDLLVLLKKHNMYFEGYFTVCFLNKNPPENYYFGPYPTTIEKIQMRIEEEDAIMNNSCNIDKPESELQSQSNKILNWQDLKHKLKK